jgi:hypothetical protein
MSSETSPYLGGKLKEGLGANGIVTLPIVLLPWGKSCAREGSDDWCPHSVRDTSRNECANALDQRKNLGGPFSEAAASQAVTGGSEGLTRLR